MCRHVSYLFYSANSPLLACLTHCRRLIFFLGGVISHCQMNAVLSFPFGSSCEVGLDCSVLGDSLLAHTARRECLLWGLQAGEMAVEENCLWTEYEMVLLILVAAGVLGLSLPGVA